MASHYNGPGRCEECNAPADWIFTDENDDIHLLCDTHYDELRPEPPPPEVRAGR